MTQDDPLTKTLSDLSLMIAESQQDSNKKNTILISFGNCSPDPFWVKDLDGKYVHVNKAMCDMFELTEAELIGRTATDIIDEADWIDFSPILIEVHDETTLERNEPCMFHEEGLAHGQKFMLLSNRAPWHDGEGKILGIVGTARNISEREYIGKELYAKFVDFEHRITNMKDAETLANLISELRSYLDRHKDFSNGN